MEWLLNNIADLVAWQLTDDQLEIEIVTGVGDPLPEGAEPVLVLSLVGLAGRPSTLQSDLAVLKDEGIWSVGHEPTSAGVRVSLEGEEWSLDVECDTLEQQRLPLQPRHYERIITQQKQLLDTAFADGQAGGRRMARLDAFLQDQVARATRILAEAASSHTEARLRAEGRLRLAQEIRNIVGGKDDTGG